jgi:hypothetical protein
MGSVWPRLPFAGEGGLSPSRGPGGALKRQGQASATATMWSTTVLIADLADTGDAVPLHQDRADSAPQTSRGARVSSRCVSLVTP